MAAPAVTARSTPTLKPLHEGFSTKIAFSLNAGIEFWEKSLSAPGYDGREAIDQTTMFNIQWVTKWPRTLIDIPDFTVRAAYSAHLYVDILAILNKQGSVTVTFPDGDTVSFYGFLRKFEPQELREGAQPEATITITVTNYDPTNLVEVGPLFIPATGTG